MLTGMMRLSAGSIGGGIGVEGEKERGARRAKARSGYFSRKGAPGEGLTVCAIFLRARATTSKVEDEKAQRKRNTARLEDGGGPCYLSAGIFEQMRYARNRFAEEGRPSSVGRPPSNP
jgi:hypothetical protein